MRSGLLQASAALCAFLALAPADAAEKTGIYDYPRIQFAYSILRAKLAEAVRSGDIQGMEAVCRQGLELMPGDAVWQYNLACALAYRATPDAAFEALEEAVRLGYRDADSMARDNDLKRIASDPRFEAILRKARETAGIPAPGEIVPKAARLTMGTRLVLDKSNLVWDFEAGMYRALFKFLRGNEESQEAMAAQYAGPARNEIAAWIADGTAAGNGGDLYINRDNDHSRIELNEFPRLSELRFEAEAKKRWIDRAFPNTLYGGVPVVGNASLAITATNGTLWAMMRAAMADPVALLAVQRCCLDNQFWVFPANKDYNSADGTDLFLGSTPCALQSEGSSGSDIPFVRAALAASAALRPDTKKTVLENRMFALLMQYLIRRTRKGVESEDDYLTAKAHPTAFDAASLDVSAVVRLAHSLAPEAVPPAVLPLSAFVPVTELDLERELDFSFTAFPCGNDAAEFTWSVVHGDPGRVAVSPSGKRSVHLSVDCRMMTDRIDVACFAKTAASGWGAPSFVSIYPLRAAEIQEAGK